MSTDPRLTSTALLEAARPLPRRGPWDLPDVQGRSSMAQLLDEAWRLVQKGGADGA